MIRAGDRVTIRRLTRISDGSTAQRKSSYSQESRITGTVVQVTDRFAVVQLRNYRECFWIEELRGA